MRVALLAYACDPDRGSEPGFGWQWTRHLLARGHDVDVLTRDDPDRVNRLRRAAAALGATGRCQVHEVPRPRTRSGPAGWREWQAYTGWLDRAGEQLSGCPADLVHHVTYGSLKFGSARTDRPLVFGPVGGAESVPAPLASALGPKAHLIERLRDLVLARSGRSRRTAAGAGLVLATNSVTLQAAIRRGARRAELMLADGLPTEYLVPAPSTSDLSAPTVLWVGSFQPRKAPMLALRAFARLRERRPAARLRMVGDGPLLPAVRRARESMGLTGAVELTGRIPWAEVAGVYDEATVFLFSSVRDAFGGQCLEAWGRGVPSVGLDQFGLADHAPGAGCLLVPVGRPDVVVRGLADALDTVLEPASHPLRSAAALAGARRHTWDAKVASVERRYAELLGGGAVTPAP